MRIGRHVHCTETGDHRPSNCASDQGQLAIFSQPMFKACMRAHLGKKRKWVAVLCRVSPLC